jgi:hypothetical protein
VGTGNTRGPTKAVAVALLTQFCRRGMNSHRALWAVTTGPPSNESVTLGVAWRALLWLSRHPRRAGYQPAARKGGGV